MKLLFEEDVMLRCNFAMIKRIEPQSQIKKLGAPTYLVVIDNHCNIRDNGR